MEIMRARLQHKMNPLHLYCRLRHMGLGHFPARTMCAIYERVLYRQVLS